MRFIETLSYRVLLAGLFLLTAGSEAWAWDTEPDANGKYDGLYDRPTHFPDWEQPSEWSNVMVYYTVARLGARGPRLENYEVAVYDQNNQLRRCSRSIAEQGHVATLTIRGTEGDHFHCQIIYGDFDHPTIVDVPEEMDFKTNLIVGMESDGYFPFTVPSRTIIYEKATELPLVETGADVTVRRTINAGEWSTICLPFAMSADQVAEAFGSDAELADFQGCVVKKTADGTVNNINVKFAKVTAIEANHPYIIKVREGIESFDVDNVSIEADEEPSVDCDETVTKVGKNTYVNYNRFVGNYTDGTLVPDQCLFLSGGKFYYSKGKTPIMALRGYFDFYEVLPEAQTSAARISLTIDDETTAVAPAVAAPSQQAGRIYDLQGRCISDGSRLAPHAPLKRGLYIQNNKKILVR